MKISNLKNKWLYHIVADTIFWLHFILVLIVVVGWLVPIMFIPSLVLLVATLVSELFLGFCPLTRLEFGIRKKINPSLIFDRSCIVHYMRRWRGLAPRPPIAISGSFLKRRGFLFVLLGIGVANLVFNLVLI